MCILLVCLGINYKYIYSTTIDITYSVIEHYTYKMYINTRF